MLPKPLQCTGLPSVGSASGESSVFCLQPSPMLLEGGGLSAAQVSPSVYGGSLCGLGPLQFECTAFPPGDISASLQGVIPCTPLSSHWFLYLSAGLISSTSIKMKYFAPLGSEVRKRGAWPHSMRRS